jgi:hypothetical protein
MAALDIEHLKAALVIGVTGHRDIRDEDREQLENKVHDVFAKLHCKYRYTPLFLLSPLAEGADQLVARVALRIGARLIVPLPMPKQLYEADFADPNSLAEFNRLLGKAEYWFEISLLADKAAVAHPGPERDQQYEAAGKYIASESHILIALWDGVESDKVGGTAAIVRFQTEGLPGRDECNFRAQELFPAYHILTPRRSNPYPEGNHHPFELKPIYSRSFDSKAEAEKYYETTFAGLNEFNRLITERDAVLAEEVVWYKSSVIGDLDERKLSRTERWTLNRYVVADALAIRFQIQIARLSKALYLLVFLSFSSFVFFAHLPDHPPIALGFAIAFLALVFNRYKRAERMALNAKRRDYRAMAEICRVSFFGN